STRKPVETRKREVEMSEAMIAYTNMAIGLLGIILTVLTAPSILHLGARVRTEDLPAEFSGLGAVLRTLGVALVLLTFMFILALGMVMTLTPVSTSLGAASPVLVTVLLVTAIYAASVTLALAMNGSILWIPGAVGTSFAM